MRKSRLSWSIQRRLIEHFVSGSTARTAASLVGVNKSTAAFYFHRLREIISLESEDASPLFGEIEVDESYFGGHRKGKRGRVAGGKISVFGPLKRGGKVYAKVIPDAKGKTLKAIIARQYRLLRYLQRLQRARCIQLQTLPHQPLRAVLRSEEPHQWASRTSGTRPSVTCAFQRYPRRPLPPLPEGVRVAIQYTPTKTTANPTHSMG
jgi:transposase-like protein